MPRGGGTVNQYSETEVGGLTLDDWNYEIDEDANKIILGRYKGNAVNVVIPSEFEEYEGKTVEIKELVNMFWNLRTLTLSLGGVDWYDNELVSLKIGTTDQKVTLSTDDLSQSFYGNLKQDFKHLKSMDLSGLDTSKVTNMSYMFANCYALESLDLTGITTDNVTDMRYMFSECNNLKKLDVSKFNTSNVTNMRNMFAQCSDLTELDVTKFDTRKVTDMSYMFKGLVQLEELDITNFVTDQVTAMGYMFFYCEKLKTIDVTHFDTSKVTDMSGMFSCCLNLEQLDVSGFNTSSVTTMESMFSYTSLLEELDVSGFDTTKVTTMYGMFQLCSNLKQLDVSKFETSNVTTMQAMFSRCNNLQYLDVSNFDTSNVANMTTMFTDCKNLEYLDLSGFDTRKVEGMNLMFEGCDKINIFDLRSFQLDSLNTNVMAKMFDRGKLTEGDPIPTLILATDEKLLNAYNDPGSIEGRIPYIAKVIYHGNEGIFENQEKEKAYILEESDHFIYQSLEDKFIYEASVLKKYNPSTSLSKEGSVFNGWYLDEACTKPFDEAATIDFTTLENGTLHLYAGYSEPLQAVELIAYEGGSGTDASNHGDALPEPQWEEGLESYAISVDGEAWDLKEEGVPFAWEYRNSEGEKVESAAKAGSYALYALPRVDDKEIRLDEHILSLPEEGMAVGEVKVREVSDESAETLSSEIYKGVYEEEGACQIKEAHAHVKAGTQFYKNGNTMYPVNEDAKIVLLWDELIEEVLGSAERMEALHAKGMEAVKGIDETKEVKREFRYLDLVDQNDGNLWVGTEKETVSVYYPYPKGSEAGDRFAVVYYEGLTRDYTMQMSEEALDEEIAKSKAREIEVRKTEGGLEFEVGSKEFGTFEVMWQKEEKPTEPEEKPTEPEEKPSEPEEKPNTPNEENKGENNIEEIKKEESEAVNTGDEVSKGMYYVLLGGSMIVFAAMLRKNRRSEQ